MNMKANGSGKENVSKRAVQLSDARIDRRSQISLCEGRNGKSIFPNAGNVKKHHFVAFSLKRVLECMHTYVNNSRLVEKTTQKWQHTGFQS